MYTEKSGWGTWRGTGVMEEQEQKQGEEVEVEVEVGGCYLLARPRTRTGYLPLGSVLWVSTQGLLEAQGSVFSIQNKFDT